MPTPEEELEKYKEIAAKQKEVIDGYTKANEQRSKTADWEGLITKGLSDQHNVLTYVSKQHTNILKATGSYLTNTKEQFLYAQGSRRCR